jgi:hypothetical protein
MLLKPHGSLNWSIPTDGQTVDLVAPYSGSAAGSIVPPTWDKSAVGNWPWVNVWREARKALRQARSIIVIGYSVPTTDQLSQALLRADIERLDSVILVNPDSDARRRTLGLLSSVMHRGTHLVELDSLEDFAAHLEASSSEPPPFDARAEVERLRARLEDTDHVADLLSDRVDEAEFDMSGLSTRLDGSDQRLDDIEADMPDDLRDDLGRLEGMINDLEARIDSITGP